MLKNMDKKNAYCKMYCFDDNKNKNDPKKCYSNGSLNTCFRCTFKVAARPITIEKEKLEKLCNNFCNHVENTPDCSFFGYIDQNKKKIDIDRQILVQLGLKKEKKQKNLI